MPLFLLMTVLTFAQNVVKGKVSDNKGLGIPGANVVNNTTKEGVSTDFDGNYQIKAEKGATLTVSFIGFGNQQAKVDGNSLDITLSESQETKLDEVVVVAYGTSKKASITGAVASITSENIGKRPITNIANALEGVNTWTSSKFNFWSTRK